MNAADVIFGMDWWIGGEPVRIRAIHPADGPDGSLSRAEVVNGKGEGYYVYLRSLHQRTPDALTLGGHSQPDDGYSRGGRARASLAENYDPPSGG